MTRERRRKKDEHNKWDGEERRLRNYMLDRDSCRGNWMSRFIYDVYVKALVCWATGKRLTNRLPKLSLITLSLPLNSGILGLRMGPYVPTPTFFL